MCLKRFFLPFSPKLLYNGYCSSATDFHILMSSTGDMPFRKEVPMLALKITDQKNFTNKLFLGDTFDLFWLNQAEIITSNVFSIDGKLQTDFFDNDEQEFLASSHRTFSLLERSKTILLFCYPRKKSASFFQNRASVFSEQDRCIIAEFCIFHFLPTDNRSVSESPI